MLVELGLKECGSAVSSALWCIGVDGVTVPRCRRCGVVGDRMKIDNGVPGNHVGELRCDVLGGCSLDVPGFLIKLEIVYRVIGGWWL